MATEERLIDANALTDQIIANFQTAFWDGASSEEGQLVLDTIDEAETVDATKVVHAEWLDIRFDSMWRSMLATCSHCKVRGEVRVKSNECGFAVPDSDYCPHCGAKMDGGAV